jgi:hypothetical protein
MTARFHNISYFEQALIDATHQSASVCVTCLSCLLDDLFQSEEGRNDHCFCQPVRILTPTIVIYKTSQLADVIPERIKHANVC